MRKKECAVSRDAAKHDYGEARAAQAAADSASGEILRQPKDEYSRHGRALTQADPFFPASLPASIAAGILRQNLPAQE